MKTNHVKVKLPKEKIADAAVVHKYTGVAPSVALHIPWDQVDDYAKLSAYAKERGVRLTRQLAVFGSALREDFRSDSDLDVLVEFDPKHTPGLAFFGMEQELSELLGRKVDLNTPQFLSPYFRDKVLEEAEVQYAKPRH